MNNEQAIVEKGISELAKTIAFVNKIHGWDNKSSDAESCAQIHGEVSELWEAFRREDKPSSKIPGFTKREEEAADIVLRTIGVAEARGFRIAEAITAKLQYNYTRDWKAEGKSC
jgi:hypothetical protein